MSNFSVEKKIALLIFFTGLIVGAAGYVTYKSLNYILTTIKKEAQPNLTLVLLKEINNNLQVGESNVKYYSLTGDQKYLRYYYDQIKLINKKVDQLGWYNQDDARRKQKIDSVNVLLNKKFRVWRQMLLLQTDNRVSEVLNTLEAKLDSVTDTIKLKVPTSIIVANPDSIKSEIRDNDDEVESKGSFFSRLFKRKPAEEDNQANPEPVVQELLHETIEEKDTSLGIGIDRNLLQEEISRLREAEGDTIQRLNALEMNLVRKNEILSQKINVLVIGMEREELKAINNKAIEANKMVQSTNKWGLFFLMAFIALLIAVFWVIQRYVRKSNAIQRNLIKSKDETIKLSKAKEVFMASMSHEIRTPMNAIVGFSEQILQVPNNFQTKEQLTIIKKSADHLLRIINDILDLSKLEAGKLTIENEPFSPKSIILDVVQLYKPAVGLKGIDFEYRLPGSIPDVLFGDAFRLKQILFNLLSNAVKFTSEGSINLIAESTNFSKTIINLTVTISDTGIGIPPGQTEQIFEEFKQADTSTTRRYGGTGLGLSIVKKLVELQNGKLKVWSQPKQGTKFSFTIPYKIGKAEDLKIQEVKQINTDLLADKSFLVADDDEYNRKLIAHILNKWKVNYSLLTNGKELIEELDKNKYDIILLDIRMPEIDGIQATEIIRHVKPEPVRSIPIIALTATIAEDEFDRCKQAGIQSVLLKPYSEELLSEYVFTALHIESKYSKSKNDESVEETAHDENGLNFDNLRRLANNDEMFVVEMLEMFIKTSREGLRQIDKALGESNLVDIAEYAHKIKSPCKHLGATDTAELLKEIEMKARNNASLNEIKDMLDKAKNDISGLIVSVEEYLLTANTK